MIIYDISRVMVATWVTANWFTSQRRSFGVVELRAPRQVYSDLTQTTVEVCGDIISGWGSSETFPCDNRLEKSRLRGLNLVCHEALCAIASGVADVAK
jgi:hypothetical protein